MPPLSRLTKAVIPTGIAMNYDTDKLLISKKLLPWNHMYVESLAMR